MSEIVLRDTIYNEELYDTDSDEEEDTNYESIDEENDYDSQDEETEELCEVMEGLLCEVANVEILGKKAFKVEFLDTKGLELVDEEEDCDFDQDDDGYPIMPDGGEEFFLPYTQALVKKNKAFKGVVMETNIHGVKITL